MGFRVRATLGSALRTTSEALRSISRWFCMRLGWRVLTSKPMKKRAPPPARGESERGLYETG